MGNKIQPWSLKVMNILPLDWKLIENSGRRRLMLNVRGKKLNRSAEVVVVHLLCLQAPILLQVLRLNTVLNAN